MKKLLLIVCAVLIGASLVGAQKAEAATYVSMMTTLYSGTTYAAWVKCDYDTVPDGSGYFDYSYTLYLADYSTYTLPSSGYAYYPELKALKVMNSSKNPVEWVSSPSSPTWDFHQGPGYAYYEWSSTTDYLYRNNYVNSMQIKSKFPPTYVVDYCWDTIPSGSGTTVGPAPEPASLSLLGLSLLGLGGAMFRRKFKA